MRRSEAMKIRLGDTISAGELGIWNAVVTEVLLDRGKRFFPKFKVRLTQRFPSMSREQYGEVGPFVYGVVSEHIPFPAVVTGQGDFTQVRL